MRISGFLTLLGVFMVLLSTAAMAHLLPEDQPKQKLYDYEIYRLENSKDYNHVHWNHDQWEPSDWVRSRGNAEDVIASLRKGGVITDQYEDDGIPILEVGENFMRLSNTDKRRVVAFVDSVYGITSSKGGNGVFFIYHDRLDKPIGLYTKHGLQIE